jgi:hypothetical protein
LIEAVVSSHDKSLVRAARRFVRSLRGELIEPEFLRRLIPFFNPPALPTGKSTSHRGKRVPEFAPLWVVPLVYNAWEPIDYDRDKTERPKAKAKTRKDLEDLDAFVWEGTEIAGIQKRDQMLQVIKTATGKMVKPPGHVVHLSPYKSGRETRTLVYVGIRKGRRRKRLSVYLRKLDGGGTFLKALKVPRQVRRRSLRRNLLLAWEKDT